MSGKRASDSWRDDRAWQAGILIGSALGAAATLVGRQMERRARQGLVDWATVERLAIGRLGSAPGALSAEELRASEPEYAAAMDRIVPALSEALGTELPGVVERSGVVDRAGWVRANTASFASLIGKLEHDLLDQVVPAGGGFTVAAMALANGWITTRQLGVLLGFMGQRVLGQYDLALLICRGRARAAAVRRGEHPPDGQSPRRAACLVPDLDRAPRDDPCVRVRGAPLAAAVPGLAPGAAADAVRPRRARDGSGGDEGPRPGAPRRGRRRALDGTPDDRRAEGALPRDPGGDEPARGLQRLRDGRGRAGARA